MPSPRAPTSLSHAAAATARPRPHRGRKVCAWYTGVRGVPRPCHDAIGQAFHESARLGMLASPTGSEMAGRQRRFLDRAEAGRLLAEVLTSLVRPPGAGARHPPRRGGGGGQGRGPPGSSPRRGRAPQDRRPRQPRAGRRRGRRRGPGDRRAGRPPPRSGHGRRPGRGRPPDRRGGQADRRLPPGPAPADPGRPHRRAGRRRGGDRLDVRGRRLLHPAGRRHPGPGGRARSARPAWPSGCGRWSTRWSCSSPPTRTSTSARSTSASPRSTTTRSCAALSKEGGGSGGSSLAPGCRITPR